MSGRIYLEKITNLISFEEIRVSSILIWNEQMDVARSIKIRGVDFAQLYSCLQPILSLINKGKDVDTIIIDVNSFIAKCVEENKQRIVIHQLIKDNHVKR